METLGLLLQNEARRIHCDPQTKSPQSNTLLPRAPSPFVKGESTFVTGVYVIANERFGLGDGTGPAEECKRTKRVQGWSRQIGFGTLFAIHTKLFSR